MAQRVVGLGCYKALVKWRLIVLRQGPGRRLLYLGDKVQNGLGGGGQLVVTGFMRGLLRVRFFSMSSSSGCGRS